MKKKQISRPTSVGSKTRKIKWNEVFLTAFAIVMIGGVFVWLAIRVYHQENQENEMKEKYKASLPVPGVQLDHKLVCMVNNTYMGVDQTPVVVQNKTYYGCCEKCVRDLTADESVRFAVDPYSNVSVDKALAFITTNPSKPGAILYFESEQNAKKYLQKN
ncbi:MAG: hypothetical protein HOP30_19800 [Cyclobacteriaceae bacterium]|nr:hypothetical protein [Cyclobacteriaceae bacterium]